MPENIQDTKQQNEFNRSLANMANGYFRKKMIVIKDSLFADNPDPEELYLLFLWITGIISDYEITENFYAKFREAKMPAEKEKAIDSIARFVSASNSLKETIGMPSGTARICVGVRPWQMPENVVHLLDLEPEVITQLLTAAKKEHSIERYRKEVADRLADDATESQATPATGNDVTGEVINGSTEPSLAPVIHKRKKASIMENAKITRRKPRKDILTMPNQNFTSEQLACIYEKLEELCTVTYSAFLPGVPVPDLSPLVNKAGILPYIKKLEDMGYKEVTNAESKYERCFEKVANDIVCDIQEICLVTGAVCIKRYWNFRKLVAVSKKFKKIFKDIRILHTTLQKSRTIEDEYSAYLRVLDKGKVLRTMQNEYAEVVGMIFKTPQTLTHKIAGSPYYLYDLHADGDFSDKAVDPDKWESIILAFAKQIDDAFSMQISVGRPSGQDPKTKKYYAVAEREYRAIFRCNRKMSHAKICEEVRLRVRSQKKWSISCKRLQSVLRPLRKELEVRHTKKQSTKSA